MRLAVVVVLGVAACADDPTLRVDVEHEVPVERTIISVYESDSLSCARIEFGDLSEDELVSARVAQMTIDQAGVVTGSLDGLSRTEPKYIVARGYVGDALMTAGCELQEEIVGRDSVVVKTVRASSASIGQFSIDSTDPFSLQVSLRDATGAALGDNRLAWRVYAPFGALPAASPTAPTKEDISGVWHIAAPTCTNTDGVRRIHPVPPATVGGFAVQVLPSWPIEPPPLVTAFTRIDSGAYRIVPVAAINHPCAMRRGGATTPSLLCVEGTSASDPVLVLREYTMNATTGNVLITKVGPDLPVDQEIVAVYGIDRSAVRDVYAVTQRGRVIGLGNPSMLPPTGANLVGELASDALVMPACGPQGPRLLLRTDAPGMMHRLVVMPELGGSPMSFHGVTTTTPMTPGLRSVGCVAELTPKGETTPRQAVVVDLPGRVGSTGRLVRSVYFDCVLGAAAVNCYVDLPILIAGAGFTPGGLLSGVNLDASGVVVSEWGVLFEPAGGYRRVEFGRVAAASFPKHIVYGNFDTDGKPDAFWDIESVAGSASAFQVTYAQLAGTQQLSALSQPQGFVVDDVLVGDVTGDSKDDILMIGTSYNDMGIPDGYGIIVIPTQVPAAAPMITSSDGPC